MRVGIIGGGSIGLLFASYFMENGHEVVLFVRRTGQQMNIRRKGLTLKANDVIHEYKPEVQIFTDAQQEDFDILVVTVKSYDVEHVLPIIKQEFDQTRSILFIQNGMQHIDYLQVLDRHSIYLGVVEHGALRVSDQSVHHTGMGQTKIAPYLDGHSGIDWGKLSSDAFPFIHHEDWYDMLSKKLHINSVINPLTALFKVTNGVLLEHPDWYQLMKRLSEEACYILDINPGEAWEELLQVCKNTSLNKSSMLRDIEEGQKTEIEAINGYLLNNAKRNQKEINDHRFVYHAVKGMEE